MSDGGAGGGRAADWVGVATAPDFSQAERRCDLAVHLVGIGLAAVGLPVMLAIGLQAGAAAALGLSLYAFGLVAMLTFSALYNAVERPAQKAWLRRCDRAAIFVMIAGTYSPFALAMMEGAWGIGLFVFIWTLAIGGAALALVWPRRSDRVALALYLAMGWSVVVALEPLTQSVGSTTVWLLLAGGVIYTAGVGFHLSRLRFQNVIWHVCVLAAAALHYAAILGGVALAAR
ncbi:MAG TPA: hemolysin III family protein [Afifellaceae bacterium]|nr:hemolysin III family protein [Afifellaceae bacterium]